MDIPAVTTGASLSTFNYFGCVAVDVTHQFSDQVTLQYNSPQDCSSFCRGEGFAWFGVVEATCFCDSQQPPVVQNYPDTDHSNCTLECYNPSFPNEHCGGFDAEWLWSIFSVFGPGTGVPAPGSAGTGANMTVPSVTTTVPLETSSRIVGTGTSLPVSNISTTGTPATTTFVPTTTTEPTFPTLSVGQNRTTSIQIPTTVATNATLQSVGIVAQPSSSVSAGGRNGGALGVPAPTITRTVSSLTNTVTATHNPATVDCEEESSTIVHKPGNTTAATTSLQNTVTAEGVRVMDTFAETEPTSTVTAAKRPEGTSAKTSPLGNNTTIYPPDALAHAGSVVAPVVAAISGLIFMLALQL